MYFNIYWEPYCEMFPNYNHSDFRKYFVLLEKLNLKNGYIRPFLFHLKLLTVIFNTTCISWSIIFLYLLNLKANT